MFDIMTFLKGPSGLRLMLCGLGMIVLSFTYILLFPNAAEDSLFAVFTTCFFLFFTIAIFCIRYEQLVYLGFEILSGVALFSIVVYLITYSGPEPGVAGEAGIVTGLFCIPGTIKLIFRVFRVDLYSWKAAKWLLLIILILFILAVIFTG